MLAASWIFVLSCFLLLPGDAFAQGTFRNPLNPGPDPFLVHHLGNYHLLTTQGASLRIWKSPTLGGLAQATPHTVWTDVTPSRCCNIWAPELYRLEGASGPRWYLYYTADDRVDAHHRMFVLESRGSDPLGPYDFKAKLATDPKDELYAIDGSIHRSLDGTLYFLWAGHPGHRLFISRMANPWTLAGPRVLLPADGFGCEEVREGPVTLSRNSKVFLTYSACDTGKPDYKLGMLVAEEGADLMNPKSWSQHPVPVFARSDANGVYGPGHHAFFKSPDGREDWILYHGKASSAYTYAGRTTRAQRFSWTAEGWPDFGTPLPLTAEIKAPSGEGVSTAVRRSGEVGNPPGASAPNPIFSGAWSATDALGRKLPEAREVGPPRDGKYVGLFYFLWHGQHGVPGPYDLTRMISANPEKPAYGPMGAFHHWGEPEEGYFLADDAWVIRRNLAAFVQLGIDFVFFDVTNGPTYPTVYLRFCALSEEMRKRGYKTPQVAFIAHSNAASVIANLHRDFYAKGLFKDQWFLWQGKPLMLGPSDGLAPAVRDFFTLRNSWAWDAGPGKWQWLDTHPQDAGLAPDGKIEQMPVAMASHPNNNIGASFQKGRQPPLDRFGLTASTGQGLHFQEQAKRALDLDPSVVLITGWNEWIAQRFAAPAGGTTMLGKAAQDIFVDAYNQEYNRDIAPMKGGHTDNHLYLLASFIRRFKGVAAPEATAMPRGLTLDGNLEDWKDVRPEHSDLAGDVLHRDHAGYGGAVYRNATGRNDLVSMKAAADSAALWFSASVDKDLTPVTGHLWMLLFLDTDRDKRTGWEGYDFVVGLDPASGNSVTVKRHAGGWNWIGAGSAERRVSARGVELRIPRAVLGLPGAVDLEFKWADNIQGAGDISDFFVNGDVAPDRRFNYRFQFSAVTSLDFGNPGSAKQGPPIGNGRGWIRTWNGRDVEGRLRR